MAWAWAAQDGNHPQPGHYGLIGMRERANQIGAELRMQTVPGQGTNVCVDLPIAAGRAPLPQPDNGAPAQPANKSPAQPVNETAEP